MNFKHLGFGDFLEEDEVVSAVFRHPLGSTFVKIIFFAGIWGGISWIVWFYWEDYYYNYSADNQYNFLWLIPAVIGAVKVFDIFMKWYANAILMTSESLVFSEFRHIFDRSASRIDYFDLDDIELEKKGMSDYLRNNGDLVFSKVGGGSIDFKSVGNPRKIIRKIRKHKSKMLNEKNFTEEGALKDLLSQLVQTHVRGKGQPEKARKFHEKVIEKEEHIEQELTKEDFIDMREEELAKLRAAQDIESEEIEEIKEFKEDENPAKKSFQIRALAKKIIPKHFHNELDDLDNKNDTEQHIEVEKELDDEGGLEIDLD